MIIWFSSQVKSNTLGFVLAYVEPKNLDSFWSIDEDLDFENGLLDINYISADTHL